MSIICVRQTTTCSTSNFVFYDLPVNITVSGALHCASTWLISSDSSTVNDNTVIITIHIGGVVVILRKCNVL